MKILHAVTIIALSVPTAVLAATDTDALLFHCSDGTAHKDTDGTWRCPDGSVAHPIFGALWRHTDTATVSAGYPLQIYVGEGTKGGSLIRTPSVEAITRSMTGTLKP